MPAHSGTASDPRRAGFSLVELIVVVAITAVLAAVAVPRFANANARYQLETATNRVISDIAVISATASATTRFRQIAYDPGSDRYTMLGIDSRGRAAHRWVDLSRPPYSADLIRASFDTNLQMLRIDGYGLAETDGFIVIAAGRHARRISVSAGSSTLRVESLTFSEPPDADVMPPIVSVSAPTDVDALAASPAATVEIR